MADNPVLDNADLADITIATDEVQVGGTQGVAQVQFVKLVDGTLNGTAGIPGSSSGLKVDVTQIAAGDNNIGNVDVVTLPALPAGANNIGDVDVLTLPAATVAGSSSLPAGTNNIGDVDVLSVIPGTAATNLGKAEDAAHTTADTGVMALAVRRDAGTTLVDTDLDYAPLQVDAAGSLRVTGAGGGTQYNEADVDTTITGTAALWEDAADTLRAVSATKPLPVNPVVSDITGAGPFDTVGVAAIPLAAPPTGITGMSIGPGSGRTQISAATTNATSIKASAGQLYWIYAHNINAGVRYLKLYNKASAPTVGSDTPRLTLPIPASTAGNGFLLSLPIPIVFETGIASALTTGVADADTGAVAANEIVVSLGFR